MARKNTTRVSSKHNAGTSINLACKPKRLRAIFQSYDRPLYFVTFCTHNRQKILADPSVHEAFVRFARSGEKRGIAFGRYVIMPDHVHVFLRLESHSNRLGTTIRTLKAALSGALRGLGFVQAHWQPGFFDHVIRHSESYAEKWSYVSKNPVRAGLTADAKSWPYQGEIVQLREV